MDVWEKIRKSRDKIEQQKAQEEYERIYRLECLMGLHKNELTESPEGEIIKWDDDLHPRDEQGRFTNAGGITKPEVNGPAETKQYIQKYFKEHPEVEKGAEKYMDVMHNVQNFLKDNPNIKVGTYDAVTGREIPSEELDGYCVTFHQNYSLEDPFGAYDSESYAAMCAIAMNELGAESVNIGYYGGNPEVSFVCKDQSKVVDFAIVHNQESVYDPKEVNTETGEIGMAVLNAYYNKETNPIQKSKEEQQ